jgi:SOS-response transcriptional repressor LexA
MARAGIASQMELARRVGVHQSSVSGWIHGAWPRIGHIEPLARALGVPRQVVEWYAGFDVPPPPTVETSTVPINIRVLDHRKVADEVRDRVLPISRVPVSDTAVAAGPSGWSSDTRRNILNLFEGHASIVAAEVTGNCMEPEIADGDVVLVDRADLFPSAGTIAAFLVEGDGIMVKRLAQDGSTVVPVDNQGTRYRPQNALMLGRVVAIVKRV